MNYGTTAFSPSVPSELERLAHRVLHGDASAEPPFRAAASRGLHILIAHRLRGCNRVDTLVDQVISKAIAALRDGTLTCSTDVPAWMCSRARHIALEAKSQQPETEQLTEQPTERECAATSKALAALQPLHRRVIMHFYLHSESKETICAAEGLTANEFNKIKSSARKKIMAHTASASAPCVA
jgi:DNA-directed RNA polymerase specialized sigma24 family protein